LRRCRKSREDGKQCEQLRMYENIRPKESQKYIHNWIARGENSFLSLSADM
jgi:hypothetical protein